MRFKLALALCLFAAPLLADGCPPAPDHSQALSQLLDDVREAPNEMLGRQISNQMWEFWADAPDEPAQQLLDEGMQARAGYDFLRATRAFDRLIAYCPEYAEGYNQRAFVNFLRQDFETALTDLDRAIALSPAHVAALSGKAMTLMELGRDAEAQEVLREAVKLNPWLSERYLLKAQPGQEL
ncbi:tetratricopeptide repeat protein [Puniceibacterium sediminis]|uniref:Tetratricopeptide repeat-containing protein n=1 Tax=Puniceibacterium sediminis TaxID=1608407 RepID=A0A238YT29_9RHOB|nr:tetratricopeptide repeat protein [Puniceibacterium sediminis]SNR73599.1 Tetratricopeptide repeat-containing protein [Puniceibacterium sediminis]